MSQTELEKRLDSLESLIAWQTQIIQFQLDVLMKHQWIGIDELKRYYMKPIQSTSSKKEDIIINALSSLPERKDPTELYRVIAYGIPPRY